MFAKTISDQGDALPALLSGLNLKLHSILIISQIVKWVIVTGDSSETSFSDCIPLVVLGISTFIYINRSLQYVFEIILIFEIECLNFKLERLIYGPCISKCWGQVFIQRLLFGKLSSCAFLRNFILTNFQVMFSDFFLDFLVRVWFMQFCMECVCKSAILIMLVFFKSPFLFLYFPVIYSVSLILICGSSMSWFLDLILNFKTQLAGVGSGLSVLMLRNVNFFHLIFEILYMLFMKEWMGLSLI